MRVHVRVFAESNALAFPPMLITKEPLGVEAVRLRQARRNAQDHNRSTKKER